MKTFIIIISVLLYSITTHAAPFTCSVNGAVFADGGQCAAACGAVKCDELIAGGSNSGKCDTSAYQGFFALNGKTYAVTKNTVTWDSVPTATIRNALENELIAQLLSKYGISQAWIGANDPLKSNAYGIVDKMRFRWSDNATITYDNWASGQPDNMLDGSSIGVSPVYGEHWGVMDSSGKWHDIGLGKDGNIQKLHAIVEFSGERACVAGKNQSSSLPSDMYCSDNIAGADDLVSLAKCETGIVFESTDTANLCPKGKTRCIDDFKITIVKKEKTIEGTFPDAYILGMDQESYDYDFGGGWKTGTKTPYYMYTVQNAGNGVINVAVARSLQDEGKISCYGEGCSANESYSNRIDMGVASFTVTPVNEPEIKIVSSKISLVNGAITAADNEFVTLMGERVMPYKFIIEYEESIKEPILTCPITGRPCIESAGGYFCSPYDCMDSAAGGIVSEEKTEEGANDDNNNGEYDDDGNCMGQIIIFPGKDTRCRLPGILTGYVGCCHEMTVAEADKPDIRLSKEQVMAGIYAAFGPAYWYMMALASIIDINICNGAEKQLGINRGYKQCKYVGKYCNQRWGGKGCIQMKDTYCCFDSEFTRAFAEAGHDLLGKSWGTPDNPLCSGFTPDELQQLSAMGISDHPAMQAFAESLGAQYSEKLLNEFKNNLSPTLEQDIKKEIEGMKE